MRAREPERTGWAVQEGVRTHWEQFGSGPVTVLLMGTFPVVDGRQWKAQVPDLARHYRVITVDSRGNGRSDRPVGPDAYGDEVYARDALAVLDATGTGAAFLVARVIYMVLYMRNPETRTIAAFLTMFSLLGLIVLSMIGLYDALYTAGY